MIWQAIHYHELQKRHGNVETVREVTLSLHRGEILTLMGRSGSGKSSLLRLLSLLDSPDSGVISIGDREVFPTHTFAARQKATLFRAMFGFVFQRFNLWPHMTVLENVALGPRVVKKFDKIQSRQVAMAALVQVKMDHLLQAMPDRLSGGETQRVAIARALAMDPDIFCLDEITSALDPLNIAAILGIIRELKDCLHKTIIIVSHHVHFTKEISDRVLFLEEGRILEFGDASAVFPSPATAEFRDFVQACLAGG